MSITVVEVRQDQRFHQSMQGFDGTRPTDRPELANVEETHPRQTGNVFSETDGTEITNRDYEPFAMVG